MNEVVNRILLAGDKLMTKMHLGQPGFMYSASRKIKRNTRFKIYLSKRTTILAKNCGKTII